ncbi:HNH endonuclease [bacterium]|nr:HNH endonuclease [bacterium]
MSKPQSPNTDSLREQVQALRRLREQGKSANRRPRRHRLTAAARAAILRRTGGRCHICGGEIHGAWDADHVFAHSAGGEHAVENFLPAHRTCNNYRWDYLPAEFELVLKLGVWARTRIERGSLVGREIEKQFMAYEASRMRRRKGAASGDRA